jgi:hypothetical protein
VVRFYDHHRASIEQTFPGLDLDDIGKGLEHQSRNPVKRLTSGPEERTEETIEAGGKRRHERRVEWWNDYDGPFCVFGHYALLDGKPRGCHSAFCVDFGVGHRGKERLAGKTSDYSSRLAAMRFPEKVIVFDDGEQRAAHASANR